MVISLTSVKDYEVSFYNRKVAGPRPQAQKGVGCQVPAQKSPHIPGPKTQKGSGPGSQKSLGPLGGGLYIIDFVTDLRGVYTDLQIHRWHDLA